MSKLVLVPSPRVCSTAFHSSRERVGFGIEYTIYVEKASHITLDNADVSADILFAQSCVLQKPRNRESGDGTLSIWPSVLHHKDCFSQNIYTGSQFQCTWEQARCRSHTTRTNEISNGVTRVQVCVSDSKKGRPNNKPKQSSHLPHHTLSQHTLPLHTHHCYQFLKQRRRQH